MSRPACAFAAAMLPPQEPAGAPEDYRTYVFIAYTLVFACIIVYLLQSHRKNRRVREDLELLERRIGELEGKRP